MTATSSARAALLRNPGFRWLFCGAFVSMLGDQFTLIALPWLVLQMSSDPLALGTVLAMAGVPRALFLLVGGALADRFSPRRVLLATRYASALLLGLLAALVLADRISLTLVYGLAFAIGLATAFSIPAATSLMPHVVPREQLQGANGLLMGVRQFSMFAGPLLAGLLIALFGDAGAGTVRDARGLGLAFLFDAASFALSAWTLGHVRLLAPAMPAAPRQALLQSVAEGLRYCWREPDLRTCFLYWGAIALFISGPIQVAMPLLANSVGQGAAAFGALASAHGAGTLLGMVFSGVRPGFRLRSFGTTILLVDAVIGSLFIPLGRIDATWQGMALLLAIGVLGGFLQVAVYTWLQRRIAPAMLGRGMSLFMLIFMGIAPLSAAVTGWMMRAVTLGQLFAGSGALLLGIVALAFAASRMRFVSDPPVPPARQ